MAEVPHLAVCACVGRVIAGTSDADASGVEPLRVDAEGFAVAFWGWEVDGLVLGFFSAPLDKGVIEVWRGGAEGGLVNVERL